MKTSRLLKRFGPWFDPFLVLGIFMSFLIPSLTLANLTPGYTDARENNNVLGTTTKDVFDLEPNLIYHQGISVDDFKHTTQTSYSFEVLMAAHTEGTFQNLLFTAHNTSEAEKSLNILSHFESIDQGTVISLIVNSTEFTILDKDGATFPVTLIVVPGGTSRVYVKIESSVNVNFANGFIMELTAE